MVVVPAIPLKRYSQNRSYDEELTHEVIQASATSALAIVFMV